MANNWQVDTLWWIITGLCNLNCKHCYIEAPESKYSQLTTAQCLAVVKQAKDAGIMEVFITGGEPFLRPDLCQIFMAIYDAGLNIRGIESNGILITESFLQQFARRPIKWYLSYDGYGYHNIMRGNDSAERRVFSAIKLLKKYGFEVVVNTVITNDNCQNVASSYEVLRELNIDGWYLFPAINMGKWKEHNRVSIDLEAKLYNDILHKWIADGRPFELMCSSVLTHKRDENGKIKRVKYICEYCYSTVTLMPDGILTPCCRYIGHHLVMNKMQNIFNNNIKAQLEDSELRKLKNITMSQLLKCNEECVSCELKDACLAGCRINAYLECGSLLAKEQRHCNLMKKYYREFYDYDYI